MKRTPIVRVLCAGLLAAAYASPAAGQPSQRAPKVLDQHVMGLNPAATLDEQVKRAHAVVRAEVLSAAVKGKAADPGAAPDSRHPPFSDAPAVYTEYTVRVLELLKAPGSDREPLGTGPATVVQRVGEYRWREYVIRANAGAPSPEARKEYVLMLEWSEALGAHQLDADGIYELGSTTVDARGGSPAASAQRGRAKEEFLEEIRQSGGDRRRGDPDSHPRR